jgi:hypothetical protein
MATDSDRAGRVERTDGVDRVVMDRSDRHDADGPLDGRRPPSGHPDLVDDAVSARSC